MHTALVSRLLRDSLLGESWGVSGLLTGIAGVIMWLLGVVSILTKSP